MEGEQFTVPELKAALRKAVCDNKIVPVLCGSAFKNKGVQPLLDAIIDLLPAPDDVKSIKGWAPLTAKRPSVVPMRTSRFPLWRSKS